jgi:hypothetical protein
MEIKYSPAVPQSIPIKKVGLLPFGLVALRIFNVAGTSKRLGTAGKRLKLHAKVTKLLMYWMNRETAT